MRKLFPLDCGHTILTDLMTFETPEEFIREARCGESAGAEAIAIELHRLKPEFRNAESLRQIFQSVPLPFMCTFYRHDILKQDDETRQKLLLDAVEAGAGMIDVIGDLYAPAKDECTHDRTAIAKQKKLIGKIHDRGAQVVMSSHPLRVMTAEEILAQLQSFRERGADVVKIVAKADTPEEFAESVRASVMLHEKLQAPFIHLCAGKFARLQRMMGTTLGAAITFGVYDYHTCGGYVQPRIAEFKALRESVHWDIRYLQYD